MLKAVIAVGLLVALTTAEVELKLKDRHWHKHKPSHKHHHKWEKPGDKRPNLCPGLTAQKIPEGEGKSKFYNRFYLYKSSSMTGVAGDVASCGFLDTSVNCKCSFVDVTPSHGHIHKVEFSMNVEQKRSNVKMYDSFTPKKTEAILTSFPDKGDAFHEIDIATDNYENYVITVVCNNKVNGKNVVYVKTMQPTPSEETIAAIEAALKEHDLPATELITIDHTDCSYPTLIAYEHGNYYKKV